MRRTVIFLLTLIILSCTILFGCSNKVRIAPENYITLTLWHNYGGMMQATMDELIDVFNASIGKDRGIIVNVTSINSSSALQEKLFMAASDEPGAPKLPDITTCYPKVAVVLAEKNLLVDLNEYFSDHELSNYVTSFVEEGKINDKLYVFPIAKSTEVLFVNQTLFNRFSNATGITLDKLSTFEGISEVAMIYYDWTDAQTPHVLNDGKSFYAVDSLFNLAQVGMKQLGSSFIENEQLNTSGDTYNHIYETILKPAVKGGYAIYDGYSSDLSKTGDIVCSAGSTAGILFYGDTITYDDNTIEKVQYTVLPYPVFKGGKQIAIQRGGGMSVISSNKQRENAAVLFLKWFTEAEQNMKFISETGYLPVTNSAYSTIMKNEVDSIHNDNIKKLLNVAISMHKDYNFYIPPTFQAFDALGDEYEKEFKSAARSIHNRYIQLLSVCEPNEAYTQAIAK